MTVNIVSSACAMAQAVRDRQISALELVDLHLQRIGQVNPKINAVVQIVADRARRQARNADKKLAKGEVPGPLHGVPVTIKDSFDTEGIISTAGTPGRSSYVPPQDAVAVARLRNAGAIILGKTNTPELTVASQACTTNPIYGRTNNPYDLARSTSGSSGGAAAIVASAGAALDLGSDTGGSIRDPAHRCGIAGIKPTSGRVPKTGHIVSYGLGPLDFLTQIGPMARYVEDLTLTLPIICGPDGLDPGVVDMPLADPVRVNLSRLRLAMYTDNALYSPQPDVGNCVQAAALALQDHVASVEEAVPLAIRQAAELGEQLRKADGLAWLRRMLHKAGTAESESSLAWMWVDTKPIQADEFSAILERLETFRSEMLQFISGFDAIICPVVPDAAEFHEKTQRDDFSSWSNLGAYNLTGYPVAVVRAGTSTQGLPIGVQIVGKPWREDVVLAIAARIESELGGYRPPGL